MKEKMKSAILILSLLFPISSFASSSQEQIKDSEGMSYYKSGYPQAAKILLLKELSNSPVDLPLTCYYLGNVYFETNKLDSASFYYKKGLSSDVENPYCQVGLAQLQVKDNPAVAAEQIDGVLKGKNKKNLDLLIAVSRAYLQNGKVDEAISYLELVKKYDSKYAPECVLGGDIAASQKKIGEACSQYEQAIYFDANCKEAYIKYARVYSKVNPQLAIEMLLKLKALQPTFLPLEKELAAVYYSAGEYRNAIAAYEAFINSDCVTADDMTKYGMVLFLAKDYAKSLDVVNKGLLREPDNLILKRLAMYDNYELKEYNKGVAAAEKFFDRSENPDYVYLDHLYYGRLLNALKKSDKAVAHYEKALKMETSKPEIWKELSETHEKMNNYGEAINSFKNYLSALGKEADVSDLFLLGRLYYYAGSAIADDSVPENKVKKDADLASADSVFSIVAQKVPDNYLGSFWRARTNSLLDPETTQGLAKPYYESALTILESKPDASKSLLVECNSYLGYYYFVKNDFPTSKTYWNKILTIDPDNETARKALEGIK